MDADRHADVRAAGLEHGYYPVDPCLPAHSDPPGSAARSRGGFAALIAVREATPGLALLPAVAPGLGGQRLEQQRPRPVRLCDGHAILFSQSIAAVLPRLKSHVPQQRRKV